VRQRLWVWSLFGLHVLPRSLRYPLNAVPLHLPTERLCRVYPPHHQ
jgi:hypothetical protein